MLKLADPAPEFSLEGVAGGEVRRFSLGEHRGRWAALFFYPADFTFICPTEIKGFQQRLREFEQAECQVLGVSVDDVASHRAWAEELGGVDFPLLADPGGGVAAPTASSTSRRAAPTARP